MRNDPSIPARRRLSRTLAAAAVLGVTAVGLHPAAAAAPPTAYAPTQQVTSPTSLRLQGPAIVRFGASVTLTATLKQQPRPSADEPVAGAQIRFEKLQRGTWVPAGEAVTGTDGAARLSVTVATVASSYRATYTGDFDRDAVTSAPASIAATAVPTSLTIGGPRSVVDERPVNLTARWIAKDGTKVPGDLTLYSHVANGPWRKVLTRTVAADGTVHVALTPRVDTWYQFRGTPRSWWTGAASPVLKVDNVPPGRPVTVPANAPRPTHLPPQPRAVGAGPNIVISTIPQGVWNSMVGKSWRPGCPVGRSGLRLMRLNYYGFDGYRHRGELVVNANATGQFQAAFRDLHNGRFPIRAMYLPDRFGYDSTSGGANDFAAMRADNTSAFNCRWVTGNPGVRSPHSYGYSLDINPFENPYKSRRGWLPNSWWVTQPDSRIVYRTSTNAVVRIFTRHGFHWTYGVGDSQHFDAR